MIRLLASPTPEQVNRLFAAARRVRARHFGRTVFLYGFLYISTYCRNRCSFCFYRRTNTRAVRYRRNRSQIVESARQLAQSGVHLIDLTAGEDPWFDGRGQAGDDVVATVKAVRRETGLPVMVSLGVASDDQLNRLAAAGADWYACYQETHNRRLFQRLRVGQDYDLRYRSKIAAKAMGLLVEEGILCGAGETPPDLVHAFAAMAQLAADQVRAMTFVPQAGTPLGRMAPSSTLRELICIALMRLAFPRLLIPASLDVDGRDGLRQRLDAGANVVTSLVPPGCGLAGVVRHHLDIEDGRRTVDGIRPILDACGMVPATHAAYRQWMQRRRSTAGARGRGVEEAC